MILKNGGKELIVRPTNQVIADLPNIKTTDFQRRVHRNSPNIRKGETELSKDPDLWMGQEKCNSEVLYEAIQREKVWRFLDDIWDVKKELNHVAGLDALGNEWDREFPF